MIETPSNDFLLLAFLALTCWCIFAGFMMLFRKDEKDPAIFYLSFIVMAIVFAVLALMHLQVIP